MKRRPPILVILLGIIQLVACSRASPAAGTTPAAIPLASPTSLVGLPTVSNPDCCWFPTTPAPIGSAVPMAGTLSVGVVGVTRPADTVINLENAANPLSPEGFEYLMVNVSVQCLPNSENQCDPSDVLQFRVIAPDDTEHELVESSIHLPAAFPSSPSSAAQIAQGNIAFLVPIAEEGLVLYAVWPNMTGVYLGLH